MRELTLPRSRANDRREQIVAAATQVLGRAGFGATSMKQIAAEAGVAPGLLHYYFDSKEALLLAVVDRMHLELLAEVRASLEGITDPMDRISAGIDQAATKCGEHPEFYRLMFDLMSVGNTVPAIQSRVREMIAEYVEFILGEVRAVTGGLPVPLPIPEDVFARTIAGAMDGIALNALFQDTDPAPQYHALKLMLIAFASMSFMAAGDSGALAVARERVAQEDD
ncbi:MAG: TetR/AcrR family transcriptional regulator [Candidatus Dormibacteria bacterium]